MTFRELKSLLAGMPSEGTAMWRAALRNPTTVPVIREPPADWWATGDRDLLASLIDLMGLRIWQAGGGKGPRPRPITRPGSAGTGKRMGRTTMPASKARAYLDRIGPTTKP